MSAYLQAVDAQVDGVVEGLYLLGSVALGDFRPEAGDIDFVAVTAQRPTAEVIVALEGGPSLYPSPLTRRRDVLAFGDMVITDAHRLYASRWR